MCGGGGRNGYSWLIVSGEYDGSITFLFAAFPKADESPVPGICFWG